MAKYCSIFWSFFKVGTFTIGGGYAMIPLMQRELVERHGWMTEEDFLDYVAVAQALPGVFAVNIAAVVGQRLRGLKGSIVAIVGNIMMPIIFILLLAMFFRHFNDNVVLQRIFMGLRPAVAALIAAPVFSLAKSAKVTIKNVWIPILSALLIWLVGVSPVVVILVAAIGGYLYGKLKKDDIR